MASELNRGGELDWNIGLEHSGGEICHLFRRRVLAANYVPGAMLKAGVIKVNKTELLKLSIQWN